MNDWVLLFSNSVHGNSLATFTRLCAGQGSTMIVVETTTGQVFGAYASSSWRTDKVRLTGFSPVWLVPSDSLERILCLLLTAIYAALESLLCVRLPLETHG